MDTFQYCVIPALLCAGWSLMCCLTVRAGCDRKWRILAACLLSSGMCAALFWRVMEVNPYIPLVMLAAAAGPSILLAFTRRNQTWYRTVVVGPTASVLLVSLGILRVTMGFRMYDEVHE